MMTPAKCKQTPLSRHVVQAPKLTLICRMALIKNNRQEEGAPLSQARADRTYKHTRFAKERSQSNFFFLTVPKDCAIQWFAGHLVEEKHKVWRRLKPEVPESRSTAAIV